MTKPFNILLLQFREDATVAHEEANSFIKFCGLSPDQLTVHNVFDTPHFPPSLIDNFDAMLIGGSSGVSITAPNLPQCIHNSLLLIQHCIDIAKPVFASCYGFQLTVAALGGEIIRDEKNFEKGTPLIHLSTSAKNDPVFQHTAHSFHAISVHQDKAITLPKHCETLAYNDQCIHAFRITKKPFWAVQFHPEIDLSTFSQRLGAYKEIYTQSESEFQDILNRSVETPESHALLKQFIHVINSPS